MPNTIRGDPVDNLVDIVQNLSKIYIPCGAERGSCDALCKRLQPLFEKVETDALGNILCLARKGKAGEKRLMLEAHIDEVALVVSEVDDEGFVRVTSPYGMDIRSVASKVMTVHGRRPVLGVMSSVPPHLKSAAKDSEPLEWDGFVLDVGLDAQKARTLICPGDRVTFSGEPALLMDGRITGRALDNRAGAAVVLRAVQLLKGRPIACELWALLSVQEEASTKGALTGAYAINPDIAVVVDVSFGRMPGVEAHEAAALSGGPMPGMAPILDRELSKRLCRAAEECGVSFQPEVMTGSTGTNAAAVQRARSGVRTALLSVPLLNMHTSGEVAALPDIEDAARVIARFVETL